MSAKAIKNCPCIICERARLASKVKCDAIGGILKKTIRELEKEKEKNMKVTCKLTPIVVQKTLADLEPGVVAETTFGIRWRDNNNFVFSIRDGYPKVMNFKKDSFGPGVGDYIITGRVLGKIDMKFEE